MALFTRSGALVGLVAAASMTVTPAAAAETSLVKPVGNSSALLLHFDQFGQSAYDGDTDISEYHRWGRRGWRRGWRRHRGVDAGDVLAGVLVLGGIAAIASAASNNNKRRDRDVVIVERDRDRDYDRRDYDRRDDRRSRAGSGIDNAVDQCVTRIERDIRVDEVDGVDRTGEGWLVTGSLFNGSSFQCRIDNNGRIADIDYGGFASGSFSSDAAPSRTRGETFQSADGQWSDDRYARARASVDGNPYHGQSFASADRPAEPLVPLTAERLPAYPGGPLPGEERPE